MTLTPTRLRCEHRADPLGIDIVRPRLSWELLAEEGRRDAMQSAYEIEVMREGGGAPAWNSGRVESGSTFGIEYDGEPLEAHARCRWRVRVWDEAGREGPWSEPALFSVGPLVSGEGEVWPGCRWIQSPEAATPNVPLMRRSFPCEGEVAAAHLYITARGIFTASINGEPVSDERFAPGWSDYRVRQPYRCYDVTRFIREGENMLGVMLNVGWYAGPLAMSHAAAHYGDRVQVLAVLRVEYADGRVDMIGSDTHWRCRASHILESTFLKGEQQDATLATPGWDQPGGSDEGWLQAWPGEGNGLKPRLWWHPGEPVRPTQVLRAVDRWRVRPGVWLFDLGQNFAGVARVHLPPGTPPGTTLRLRHGEMVNPDRTLYTGNLRDATSIDTYTARGDTNGEYFEPLFTFHGFQYLEVAGWPEHSVDEPTLENVEGVVLHSDCDRTGDFTCSDEMVNRLYRNAMWTQRANWIDIPTDCPQRDERLGWTGDAQAFIRTAAWNFDVAGFFAKWLTDVRDEQQPGGAFPNVAPRPPLFRADRPTWLNGDAAWGDAGLICPMTLYHTYGDRRVLEQMYGPMRRWVERQVELSEGGGGGGLRRFEAEGVHVWGDWLNVDAETDKSLIMTAFFGHDAALLSEAARVLEHHQDAAKYQTLHQTIARAFVAEYVHEDGRVAPPGDDGTTQTACLLVLRFDLLPENRREHTFARLIDDLEAHGWRLTTGFVGLPYLLPVLSRFGRSDVAYRLLLNREYPSWGYSIDQGATSIWERWNGWLADVGPANPTMNSFSHYAYGSVAQWLYEDAAGIQELEPGFGRVRIRPRVAAPVGGDALALTHAEATYHSIRGPIRSAWRVDDGRFTLDVTLPPNVRGEVWVPDADGHGGHRVVKVGSGRHEFESRVTLAPLSPPK